MFCGYKPSKKTYLALSKLYWFLLKSAEAMSWCNFLQRTGSDFCATDNFQGTFADFHFTKFTQKRISMYLVFMSVKSLTVKYLSNPVVNVPLNC